MQKGGDRMGFENEARVFFPGKAENVAFARLFTSVFFTQIDPTVAEMADIKTAVSEAVTNAVIHGYEDRGGIIELFCAYRKETVYIEVSDKGKGISNIAQAREPLYTSKPELERSGMGFTIMETFMDLIQVDSIPEQGTCVHMEKTLIRE